MVKLYKTLILFLFLLFAAKSMALDPFVYKFDYKWHFDNREYKSEFTWPQTIFAMRATPEIGARWGTGNGHSAMIIGGTAWKEFGSKSSKIKPELILYYNFQNENANISVGRFPRNQFLGNYSTAFFSDSVKLFDSNIDGLLLQYVGERGYVELACDWDSRQTDTEREKFMIISSGKLTADKFYAGYNMLMHHHAGTALTGGVVDNIWVFPHAGFRWASENSSLKLGLKAGWLKTFQNDRSLVGEYHNPEGFQTELNAEFFRFGVFNTLYIGDNIMPYYDNYGNGLYFGDSFYRTTTGKYDRLELYWHPNIGRRMNLKVASVHHYDGKIWGWQQLITFSVKFNSRGNFMAY